MNGAEDSIIVFAKRVVRFNPERVPVIPFGVESNLDALISVLAPVGYIVLVGTMDEPTLKRERGCLLGMAEFLPIPIDTIDLVGYVDFHDDEMERGKPRWPNAVPITRAWRFNPQLKLLDVLEEQLTFGAASRAVPLSGSDARTVLALMRKEIPVRSVLSVTNEVWQQKPSIGPVPRPWCGIVTKGAKSEAWTYVLQFGGRSLWKIGFASDVDRRLAEINQHIPFEELGEQWRIVLRQRAVSALDAYTLEQSVLSALAEYRSVGERVRCTEEQLRTAWAAAMELAAATDPDGRST